VIRRSEAGITLIELLIAITLTGIMMGTLSGAIFIGFHTTGGTQKRVEESTSANILSSYFGSDVQSAQFVGVNVSESTGICGAGAAVVGLLLTDAGRHNSVSYYQGTGAQAAFLYRRTCSGGTAAGPTRVLSNLTGTAAFNCSGVGGAGDCTDAGWQSVSATATQNDSQTQTPYTTALQGSRRVT
jgi:Prokaryotic N-terminal methylation motif